LDRSQKGWLHDLLTPRSCPIQISREQRLEKAALSFKPLDHYFNLSLLPHAELISYRFDGQTTTAVTFGEESGWLRVVNSTLIMTQFIFKGDESWLFPRLGIHCLENFVGLVRQSSRGDDRPVRAIHELELQDRSRGREKVEGTMIGPDPRYIPRRKWTGSALHSWHAPLCISIRLRQVICFRTSSLLRFCSKCFRTWNRRQGISRGRANAVAAGAPDQAREQ
jgi:hypothetical protein